MTNVVKQGEYLRHLMKERRIAMTYDNNFTRALTFTMKWEGWFSNDKVDPGGKTKFGISDAGDGTVDGLADLNRDGVGDVPVESLTREQAMDIYYKFYWLACRCNTMNIDKAVMVFDTAVNCGVTKAERWSHGITDLSVLYQRRMDYYINLIRRVPKFAKYQKGWINRMVDLRKYCEILAKEVVPQPSYVTKLESKNGNNS
jgi:lysozyme family protein